MTLLTFAPAIRHSLGLAPMLAFVSALVDRPAPPAQSSDAPDPALWTRIIRGSSTAEEDAAMRRCQREFSVGHQEARILVYPVRIGNAADTASAVDLARSLMRARICGACGVAGAIPLLPAGGDPAGKALWNFARAFRERAGKTPLHADYALQAEYAPDAGGAPRGFVQFVLCDRRGDWVVVDREDFCAAGQPSAAPVSNDDYAELVARGLRHYAAGAADDSAADGVERRRAAGIVAGAALQSILP